METVARVAGAGEAAERHQFARLIPDDTALDQLRHLHTRYSADDPAMAALPPPYRLAMLHRVRHLLGHDTGTRAVS